MADTDLPPMGEAFAKVEPQLIYGEAKRQFEALQREALNRPDSLPPAPDDLSRPTALSPASSNQHNHGHINLPAYYRALFEQVASAFTLDVSERLMLLTLCFAYKTKARVLYFLDLLDSQTFRWLRTFKTIIHNHAVDTLFAAPQRNLAPSKANSNSTYNFRSKDPKALKGPAKARARVAGLKGTETGKEEVSESAFVVTTLPLAFPTHFFTTLVMHAPLASLTLPNVLAYPAAGQLWLADGIRSIVDGMRPDFWRGENGMKESSENESKWNAFFDNLLTKRGGEVNTLCRSNGAELRVETEEGEMEVGYSRLDLEMWLAGWKAERQKVVDGGVLGEGDGLGARVGDGAGKKRKVAWGEGITVENAVRGEGAVDVVMANAVEDLVALKMSKAGASTVAPRPRKRTRKSW
ncbi:hypothetical protein BCR34DRAFT_586590 [Clohesyomyces aquaticus]|uniref:Uncharacterized protein n=1 Tax=Clohesyomyces aquaticus TaxID=1231657 RepID=A0A1Y1ZSM2_9PLEO|nr:hypothetical protein BCR34DRAFT_586590 [Clohesyomyces aquaticus]